MDDKEKLSLPEMIVLIIAEVILGVFTLFSRLRRINRKRLSKEDREMYLSWTILITIVAYHLVSTSGHPNWGFLAVLLVLGLVAFALAYAIYSLLYLGYLFLGTVIFGDVGIFSKAFWAAVLDGRVRIHLSKGCVTLVLIPVLFFGFVLVLTAMGTQIDTSGYFGILLLTLAIIGALFPQAS